MDIENAHSLIHNWLPMPGARVSRDSRVKPSDLIPSDADLTADIHRTAADLCDQIKAAFSVNNPAKAYVAGVKLNTVLERLVADLPATPRAKFLRMEHAVNQQGRTCAFLSVS